MCAFKYSYDKSVISLEQLLQDYDDKLFREETCRNHASLKSSGYNLRTLGRRLCAIFFY